MVILLVLCIEFCSLLTLSDSLHRVRPSPPLSIRRQGGAKQKYHRSKGQVLPRPACCTAQMQVLPKVPATSASCSRRSSSASGSAHSLCHCTGTECMPAYSAQTAGGSTRTGMSLLCNHEREWACRALRFRHDRAHICQTDCLLGTITVCEGAAPKDRRRK